MTPIRSYPLGLEKGIRGQLNSQNVVLGCRSTGPLGLLPANCEGQSLLSRLKPLSLAPTVFDSVGGCAIASFAQND